MQTRPRQNAAIFNGILGLVVAWRIVDLAGDDWIVISFAGWLGLAGIIALINSVSILHATRGPRPLTRVPPLWLIAWVVVLFCAFTVGTPHLCVGRQELRCSYFGWNGVDQVYADNCPLVTFLTMDGGDKNHVEH